MRILALSLALIVAVMALPTEAPAAQDPHMCLKTCIDTYGKAKKQACALQCGFGKGASGGGQRDCGTIYKNCINACKSNSSCKNQCRKQRTSCY